MSRKPDKRKENRILYVAQWLLEFDMRHRLYLKHLKTEGDTAEAQSVREGAREMLELSLEILRACYSVSGNPIFIWWAVKVAIQAELPSPSWVQEYLLTCSQSLLNQALRTDSRPQKDLLEEAMRFKASPSNTSKGSKNRFQGFMLFIEQARMMADLYRARFGADRTLDKIEDDMAAKRYPNSEKLRESFKRTMKDLRAAFSKFPADIDI